MTNWMDAVTNALQRPTIAFMLYLLSLLSPPEMETIAHYWFDWQMTDLSHPLQGL
jgi:hypothetical protein